MHALPETWPVEVVDAVAASVGEVHGSEPLAGLSGDTPVSGDPNPRNWGVRADGSIALFDWERAGCASPAVDVAITLPGLPTTREADDAASAYAENRQRTDAPLQEPLTARALLLLKLWTAVELLAEDRDDDSLLDTQRWLTESLPAWLTSWT